MKVTLAKSAGFCFGVKRAVELVYEQLSLSREPIYTYGPIIHNEEVVAQLAEKGVQAMAEGTSPSDYKPGTVIIRSHGISRKEEESLKQAGFHVVDATCPFVRKIHRYVDTYSKEGAYILVVGNANHPEVQGITGWIQGDDYSVISKKEDIDRLPDLKDRSVCIVSQTTFNYNKFQELVEIVKEKGYDIIVLNTICNATEQRQKEAAAIAREADAMIVIGGKNSSNTQKLFEICRKECEDTYYIQTKEDLDVSVFQSISNVGITAGASTPNNIIEEVQKICQK